MLSRPKKKPGSPDRLRTGYAPLQLQYSAEQRICRLFEEEDVHYSITRLENMDLYHIVVDPKRNEILDNRMEPISYGIDLNFDSEASIIIRTIDGK